MAATGVRCGCHLQEPRHEPPCPLGRWCEGVYFYKSAHPCKVMTFHIQHMSKIRHPRYNRRGQPRPPGKSFRQNFMSNPKTKPHRLIVMGHPAGLGGYGVLFLRVFGAKAAPPPRRWWAMGSPHNGCVLQKCLPSILGCFFEGGSLSYSGHTFTALTSIPQVLRMRLPEPVAPSRGGWGDGFAPQVHIA